LPASAVFRTRRPGERLVPLSIRALIAACTFALSFALSPAGRSSAGERFDEWRPLARGDWTLTREESLQVRHAIVIFDGYLIDDRGKGNSFSRYVRVRVLDQRGLDAHLTVELPFEKGRKIVKLRARTVKPDGSEIPVDGKDIHEKNVLSGPGLKIKSKVFAFSGADVGDILEYFYTINATEYEVPNAMPQGRAHVRAFDLLWFFQKRPAELGLSLASEYPELFWAVTNGYEYGARVEELPDPKNPESIHVTCSGLPAIEEEPYGPSLEAVALRVLCCYKFPYLDRKRKFWERISEANGEAVDDFLGHSSRLGRWMQAIESAPRDFRNDVDACFDLVHRDVRNVGFLDDPELEEAAAECDDVDDVLERGLAGTRQLNFLFAGMLRRLGYPATVFAIRDRESGVFVSEWERLSQLTMGGVVARSGEENHWFFPGWPHARRESIPWQAQGCTALLFDQDGDDGVRRFPLFATLPRAPAVPDRVVLEAWLAPAEGRQVNGRVVVRWMSPSDVAFPQSLDGKSKEEAVESLRDSVFPPSLEWSSLAESVSVVRGVVSYSCSLSVRNIVEDAGARRIVDLGPIRADDYVLSDTPRRTAVDLGYPVRFQSRIELRVPAGSTVEALPKRTSIHREFGRLEAESSLQDSVLVLQRDLNLTTARLPAAAAEGLRGFFQEAYSRESQTVVLLRSAP